MRLNAGPILLLLSLLMFHSAVQAQENTNSADTVDQLRVQLIEVQAKEDSLRIRAQQLDEDLKPENIERSLAGIGSTKPEELREQRRRQLTIERDGVGAQLKILEISRSRLEAAVTKAEAKAYQESAIPVPLPMPLPPTQMFAGNSFTLVGAFVTISIVLLLTLLVAVIEVSTTSLEAVKKNLQLGRGQGASAPRPRLKTE